MKKFNHFSDGVWCVDFEFHAPPGHRQQPLCVVAKEILTGKVIRQWLGDSPGHCPFPTGANALYVAHLASAEIHCHLQLGWPLPTNVLDTLVEFRRATNGVVGLDGERIPSGLLRACEWFGISTFSSEEKELFRGLAIRGGPFTNEERRALVDYCGNDVELTAALLLKLEPYVSLPYALIRGRYMSAVAHVEHNGIPIDTDTLETIVARLDEVKAHLISEVDEGYGVFDGVTFREKQWLEWCNLNRVPWPRLESGRADLKRDTFSRMSRCYSAVRPMHELRHTISELRLDSLTVGPDGRNRYLSGCFSSKTGRNQPSNAKGIFGPAAWVRSLIKPEPGRAVAYVDWSQQEVGVGAVLSGDVQMQKLYHSEDPYLRMAIMAGAAPEGATKASHKDIRAQYKEVVLGTGYGMGAQTLAMKAGTTEAHAQSLLRQHRELFPHFWKWSDYEVDVALLGYPMNTPFDWRLNNYRPGKMTSYRNWRIQSTSADILRIAVIALVEHGIKVCAMVHDAVLIEADTRDVDETVRLTQELMKEAGRTVLGGFELNSDAEIFRYPDHYRDDRGVEMFARICRLTGVSSMKRSVSSVKRGVSSMKSSVSPMKRPSILYRV